MVIFAAANRHFSKLDLCACKRRYGGPWRPEEGGCEWHNTGAGVQILILCTKRECPQALSHLSQLSSSHPEL